MRTDDTLPPAPSGELAAVFGHGFVPTGAGQGSTLKRSQSGASATVESELSDPSRRRSAGMSFRILLHFDRLLPFTERHMQDGCAALKRCVVLCTARTTTVLSATCIHLKQRCMLCRPSLVLAARPSFTSMESSTVKQDVRSPCQT